LPILAVLALGFVDAAPVAVQSDSTLALRRGEAWRTAEHAAAGSGSTPAWRPFSLLVSLGRDGLGLGLEARLLPGLAITARGDGAMTKYATLGWGLRLDPIVDSTARAYGVALMGRVMCNSPIMGNPWSCVDHDPRKAWGGVAGVEIMTSDTGRWTAGVEAGYWWARDRDVASRTLDYFTFAATLRFRFAAFGL